MSLIAVRGKYLLRPSVTTVNPSVYLMGQARNEAAKVVLSLLVGLIVRGVKCRR